MNEIRYETIIYWDSEDKIFVADIPTPKGRLIYA